MQIFDLFGDIRIEGMDRVFSQIGSLGSKLSDVGGQITRFGSVLTASVTVPLVAIGYKSLMLASDLSESANVINVTFGKNADDVKKWSKNLLNSYGLVELEAQKYVGSMGAMLKSSGLSAESSTNMSKKLVELTGDMSSFYNLSHEATWEKIRAGISGETEPLKQLGINMSVANLEAYALSVGIKKPWLEMSQSEQVQLRYNYLLKASADAQGDFSRTSDQFANMLRIVQGKLMEVGTSIGNILLPYATKAIQIVSNVMDKFRGLNEHVQKVIIIFALIAAAVGPLLIGFGTLIMVIGGVISAVGTIAGVLAGISPVAIAVVAALGAFLAVMTGIYAAMGYVLVKTGAANEIFKLMKDVFNEAKPVFISLAKEGIEKLHQAFALVKSILDDIVPVAKPFLLQTIKEAKPIISEIIVAIKNFGNAFFESFGNTLKSVKQVWDTVWPALKPIVELVFGNIKVMVTTALDVIKGIINTATAILKGDWSGAWDGIKSIFGSIWNGIKSIASNSVDALVGVMSKIGPKIQAGLSAIPGIVSGVASSAASAAVSVGTAIVNGIVNGIKNGMKWVANAASDLAKSAVTAAKNALGIKSPSKVFQEIGDYVNKGFVIGVDENKIKNTMAAIANTIKKPFIDINKIGYNQSNNLAGITKNNTTQASNVNNFNIKINFDDINDVIKLKNFFNQLQVESITRGGEA